MRKMERLNKLVVVVVGLTLLSTCGLQAGLLSVLVSHVQTKTGPVAEMLQQVLPAKAAKPQPERKMPQQGPRRVNSDRVKMDLESHLPSSTNEVAPEVAADEPISQQEALLESDAAAIDLVSNDETATSQVTVDDPLISDFAVKLQRKTTLELQQLSQPLTIAQLEELAGLEAELQRPESTIVV